MEPTTHLGRCVREARRSRGLSRVEAVRALGYANVAKGLRRLDALEGDGECHPAFWKKLVAALHLDEEQARIAAERDRAEAVAAWEVWADAPVPFRLVGKPFAGFFLGEELPDDVAHDEALAEEYACRRARERGFQMFLVLDRRRTVCIDSEGQVTARTEARPGEVAGPHMRIGWRRRPFLITDAGRPEPVEEPPGTPTRRSRAAPT